MRCTTMSTTMHRTSSTKTRGPRGLIDADVTSTNVNTSRKRNSMFYLTPISAQITTAATTAAPVPVGGGATSTSPGRSRSSSVYNLSDPFSTVSSNDLSLGSTPSPHPPPRQRFDSQSQSQYQQDYSDSESWTINDEDRWIHGYDDLRDNDYKIEGNQIVHEDGSVVELTERQLQSRKNRVNTLKRKQLMKRRNRPENVRDMFENHNRRMGGVYHNNDNSNDSRNESISSSNSSRDSGDSPSASSLSLSESRNQLDIADGPVQSKSEPIRELRKPRTTSSRPSSEMFPPSSAVPVVHRDPVSSHQSGHTPFSDTVRQPPSPRQRQLPAVHLPPLVHSSTSKLASNKIMSQYRSTPNLSEPKFSISTRLKNFFSPGKSKKSLQIAQYSDGGDSRNRSTSNSSNGSGQEKISPILEHKSQDHGPKGGPRPSVGAISQSQLPARQPLTGQRSLAGVQNSTNSNSVQFVRNHKKHLDSETEIYGVKIRYIKYNASYRQLQKPKHKKVVGKDSVYGANGDGSDPDFDCDALDHYQLLEPIAVTKTEVAELGYPFTYDFGVNFHHSDGWIKSLSIQSSVTFYEDLTTNLSEVANTVALYELEADLDTANIKNQIGMDSVPKPRFKDKRKKFHPNLLFGGYLTQLHKLDKVRGDFDSPSILKHMIEYISEYGIHEEGIFRLTGTQNRILKLKDEITGHYQNQFYKQTRPGTNRDQVFQIFERYTVHDVASLLKLFLRELAQPLLTEELMEIFLLVPSVSSVKMQAKILNLLMLVLNETHRKSLCHLLDLLNLVVQNQHHNKMSLENVATVMAPNLFVKQTPSSPANHLAVPSIGGGGGGNGGSSSAFLNLPRMSVSNMSINELVSSEMATYLERTGNSMLVLKLLVNLQPILFHIPPCIYRQMKFRVNK